ncbi:carboxymuconolactone decarboxylase family protein [Olsenella sp. YH-ols2217]|uniref:Carboxymuconolactone decarboxylase family protein n=1 Tax=Kribbibacterium absianum TaxID=3044210 RepID=A0ABT6ZKG6_9ACTN|nr:MULTISPECIES: carboxymuconolactone decarboxylase family protein [unclassified Olsenella]MDJ1122708.1 carboxymuconolactone decarboxylase family protein [Olsenella sp. YH-ols2216]MDJ1129146.1 carboxymuconolactone decarboxylase family protein [Olsenella sp. YH-ols2217]
MPKIVQTAGRDSLGDFAPAFAAYNDDVLFGEVWSDDTLPLKTRSLLTITTLVAKGLVDSSFTYHLATAKANGVTAQEMAAALTHVAFYAGWPNAWAAFREAVKVYGDEQDGPEAHGGLFGLGQPNDAFAQYFDGRSWLNPLTDPSQTQSIANVTFEPGCRNHWHVHEATSGGGQILLVTDGRGWYQEWGEPAQELTPGTVVYIPAGVKHWHGAAGDSWMSHIAFEAPGEGCGTTWLEAVADEQYGALE